METGKIVIKTEIDTQKFDKQIAYLRKKTYQIEAQMEEQLQNPKEFVIDITKAKSDLEKISNQMTSLVNKRDSIRDVPEDLLPETEFVKEISGADELLQKLQDLLYARNKLLDEKIYADVDSDKIDLAETRIQEVLDKLEELTGKKWEIEGLTDVEEEAKQIKTQTNETNNGLLNIIKNVGRWALAVFGVRTAYMAIRQAMNVLTQYDSQLAADLQYIQFALAYAVKPIIDVIVGLVFKILQYINYLYKAWTGNNLFKSAKNFRDMANSSKKTAKNTKEINKNLSAIDEITNLDQQTSAADVDAGAGVQLPSEDLIKDLSDDEVPPLLKMIKDFGNWVIKNWPIVLGVLGAIGGALLIKKIIDFIKKISGVKKGLSDAGKTAADTGSVFKGFFDGLGKGAEALGILFGVSLVIKELTKLIETFSESGLELKDVGILLAEVLGSVAIAFAVLAASTKLIDIKSAVGAIGILAGLALVLETITGLIETLATTGTSVDDVGKLLLATLGAIVGLMTAVAIAGPAMTAGIVPFAAIIGLLVVVLGTMALTIPVILKALGNFISKVAPSITEILQTIGNIIQDIIYALGSTLPGIIESIGNLFTSVFNGIAEVISSVGNVITQIMQTADRLVGNTLGNILNFIKELGPAINSFVDGVIRAVTRLINFVISGVEYLINTLIINAMNNLISTVNKIPLVNVPKIKKVKIDRFIPKLAKGGIVNNPGKGINMGSYIAGERGAEAILPLKNSAFVSDFAKQVASMMGSDMNTELLLELNKNILELANKPTYFIVNGKELAQATYDDFQNEGRRQQKSATVVRS